MLWARKRYFVDFSNPWLELITTLSAEIAAVTDDVDLKLPIWTGSHPIVFLHIGKSGGTSFNQVLPSILSELELVAKCDTNSERRLELGLLTRTYLIFWVKFMIKN